MLAGFLVLAVLGFSALAPARFLSGETLASDGLPDA